MATLFCMLNVILLYHTEHSELRDFTAHSLMSLLEKNWLPSSNTTKDRQCESFTAETTISRLRVDKTAVYCERVQISVPIFPLLQIITARNGCICIQNPHTSIATGADRRGFQNGAEFTAIIESWVQYFPWSILENDENNVSSTARHGKVSFYFLQNDLLSKIVLFLHNFHVLFNRPKNQ